MENINWYPGHMKKTRELIRENLKLVDVVVELLDARIPVSSKNPIIDELVSGKPRIIALNKSDLADSNVNKAWKSYLEGGVENTSDNEGQEEKTNVVLVDSMHGKGVKELMSVMQSMEDEINKDSVILKDLAKQEQEEVKVDKLIEKLDKYFDSEEE